MSQANDIAPCAYCPNCCLRRPIRWRKEIFEPATPEAASRNAEKDPNDFLETGNDSQIDYDTLDEYDLFGTEYEPSKKKSKKQEPSKIQPLPTVDTWFECAICGCSELKLEYITQIEAIRRNRLRDLEDT